MVWGLLTILVLEPTSASNSLVDKFPWQDLILRLRICSPTPMRNLWRIKTYSSNGDNSRSFPSHTSSYFHDMPFRVSQVKNEEISSSLKLDLLDNEENLFDLRSLHWTWRYSSFAHPSSCFGCETRCTYWCLHIHLVWYLVCGSSKDFRGSTLPQSLAGKASGRVEE